MMTFDAQDFQQKLDSMGEETLVIVDFFMTYCHYCVQFKPQWNKIVDEFQAIYGE